jgi:nickel-dependent lactate racemase
MTFEIPDLAGTGARCLGNLVTRSPGRILDADDIRRAFLCPAWNAGSAGGSHGQTVFDTIRPGESVCIAVSDHTRKTAADRVLPALLEGLERNGCSPADMSILFASGIHRHPTDDEAAHILGAQVADRFKGRVFMHDPDDNANLVAVGTSGRGHTVRLNRRAVEARRLVLTGSVVYHYHAGFGGGRKTLVPGLASRDTIAQNHSLSLDLRGSRFQSGVEAGRLDGNPVAEEMLEDAQMRRPDFIVNTVLTPDDRLAGVFAGDMEAAHAAACRCARDIYGCPIPERADLVIASAGSALNWVQSHKALYNADRAVKPGGRIILFAPCQEGIGDSRFRHWVTRPTLEEIFAGLRKNPEVLGQTALSTRIRGAGTILVTRMPPADAKDLGIKTAPDLPSAITETLELLRAAGRSAPTCYIMPEALYTVPFPLLSAACVS